MRTTSFRFDRASGLAAEWTPAQPEIRAARARRKFFAAYKEARREFLTEVAAVLGGGILVVDADKANAGG